MRARLRRSESIEKAAVSETLFTTLLILLYISTLLKAWLDTQFWIFGKSNNCLC